MYKDYFRFSSFPFHNTPNPDFYFDGPSHREALATMVYAVQEGKGFVLVIGDVGTGKTMLVQALKRELGGRNILIEISHPWVSPEDVLNIICTHVGLSDAEREGPSVMDVLRRRLIDLDEQGKRTILVIDEAHQLPERTLEGIRLLSNVETPDRKLIQIVLLGQEEILTLLGQHSMRQLQQRIAFSCRVRPMGEQETGDYIRHRLRVAGGDAALFTPDSLAQIYRSSGGSPRIINHLCDVCLLIVFSRNGSVVDTATVQEAVGRMIKPLMPQLTQQWAAAEAARSAESPRPEADLPPPFELPAQSLPPGWGPEAGEAAVRPRGGNRRLVLYGLIAGLLVGAGSLWLSQDLLTDHRRPSGGAKTPGQNPAPAETPGQVPAVVPVPREALPFPYFGERVAQAPVVTVSEKNGITLLASSRYGAWNDTVQDILYAANPEIADLDRVAPGTPVRIPQVSREGMIVQDARGMLYVYYASFQSEDSATASLLLLKQTWGNAFATVAQRHGAPVHRIYIGEFANRHDAEVAVGALWFKYLPTIN